jgi:putative peptidoglycan lipid II flippase
VSIPGEPDLPDEPGTVETSAVSGDRLVRSSAVVAIGTGLSRLTGLARTVALAYAVGTTFLGESYNLANTTPNMIYDLLLGGILSATLIPVFVDNVRREDDRASDAVLTVATVALIAVTLLGMAASPLIVRLYTAGLPPDQAHQEASVAVPLMVLFLPQVLFYGWTALGTALLNARRRFAVPAMAPVLNNIVVIAMLLTFARVAGSNPTLDQVHGDTGLLLLLGVGTTAGIAAMTLVLWPAIVGSGARPHWHFDHRNPAVRTVARLSGWTLGAVAANQAALFVTLRLLNGPTGEVSAYTYAFIFFQLPYGLLAVSIMTTFMPELASLAAQGDDRAYRRRFGQGLRLILLVTIPAAVGYVFLAEPIISVLLGYGAFTRASAQQTTDALVWLAVGLPGFATFLYAMRGFYARKDTRTPFFLYLVENGLNIVLAVALVGRFGLKGVIASYSIAYAVSAVLALALLRRRTRGLDGRALTASLARIGVAAVAMAAVVWPISRQVGDLTGLGGIMRIGIGTAAGIAVYASALWLTRSPDLAWVLARVRRRPAPSADGPMP